MYEAHGGTTDLRSALKLLRLPVDDYLAALERALPRVAPAPIAALLAAIAASWWVYVPIHELLHAAGCILGGGEVTRLDIDAVYGAALLKRVFPFVSVGSDYAGQLTGFDTKGSDLTYLLTDFLPFTLTIAVGVPLLRFASTARSPLGAALALGASVPIAYAPFVSITGDFYEMGSIIATRVAVLFSPSFDIRRWRSDDLFKLAGELFSGGGGGVADAAGLAAGFMLGAAAAFGTYAAGRLCATKMGLGPRVRFPNQPPAPSP